MSKSFKIGIIFWRHFVCLFEIKMYTYFAFEVGLMSHYVTFTNSKVLVFLWDLRWALRGAYGHFTSSWQMGENPTGAEISKMFQMVKHLIPKMIDWRKTFYKSLKQHSDKFPFRKYQNNWSSETWNNDFRDFLIYLKVKETFCLTSLCMCLSKIL